jgi:hypothetical protein
MKSRKYILISFTFWSIFIALGIYSFRKQATKNRAVQLNELTTVQGTLGNKPTIQRSKNGAHIDIEMKEFPNFIFTIGNARYMALSRDFTTEVLMGDTINLAILTYDYETKIRKTESLSLPERIANYKFIEPFAVHSRNISYMTLENTNIQIEDNRLLGSWAFSIGAFLFLIYTILYWTGSIKKFAAWWNRMQASR